MIKTHLIRSKRALSISIQKIQQDKKALCHSLIKSLFLISWLYIK